MAVLSLNWDTINNFIYKKVDSLSVFNQRNEVSYSAWLGNELIAPTTKLWLLYKLTENDKIYTTGSELPPDPSTIFSKTIFPSITTSSFLTQSSDSYVYYLDVYSSNKIPVEIDTGEHLYETHGIYADSSNLLFNDVNSSTGYSAVALIPKDRAFTLAWGSVSQSIGNVNNDYTPSTYFIDPCNTVYKTYKQLLNQTGSLFHINETPIDSFYAIHLVKESLKNGIVPGTIEMPFMVNTSYINFSASNIYTNEVITLHDSGSPSLYDPSVGMYGYIYSGSSNIYGAVYYQLGIIIIDSKKIDDLLNINLNEEEIPLFNLIPTSYYYEDSLNTVKLFNSLQAASYFNTNSESNMLITSGSGYTPYSFKCIIKEETVNNPVYIYIRPGDFNYSTNPTYAPNGNIRSGFINNPVTYISSIGLYNDNYELLAVAKLSRPLKKTQFTSYLFKVNIKA